jgi:hypothetical protein
MQSFCYTRQAGSVAIGFVSAVRCFAAAGQNDLGLEERAGDAAGNG